MDQFWANLPHMIMATIVIIAAVVLGSTHVITGGEALGLIAGAGGFTLGAGASSASVLPVTVTAKPALSLTGAQPTTDHLTPSAPLPMQPTA